MIRTGRHNGHTLYLQRGAQPGDNDLFLGSCVTPSIASAVALAATVGFHHHPDLGDVVDAIDRHLTSARGDEAASGK
jgi:hypothetical protein